MREIVKTVSDKLTFAESFIEYTKLELDDIKNAFFKIGFRLNEAVEFGYYHQLGYKDIYELAEKEFGFKATTTKNLMIINRRFCDHYGSASGLYSSYTMVIAKEYDGYSQTQLVEMAAVLNSGLLRVIKPEHTVEQIRTIKKAAKHYGESFVVDTVKQEGVPQLVEKYNEDVQQQKTEKKLKEEIPEGQLFVTDNSSIEEFKPVPLLEELEEDTEPAVVFDGEKALDETQEDEEKEVMTFVPQPCGVQVQAELPKKHLFKNKKEREDFIKNSDNYNVLVLRNEELDLTVKRLDLANGAKIYLTEYKQYSAYHKKIFGYTRLSLVDADYKGEPLGQSVGVDIVPKTYTLDGTAPTYILDYMTKNKDVI